MLLSLIGHCWYTQKPKGMQTPRFFLQQNSYLAARSLFIIYKEWLYTLKGSTAQAVSYAAKCTYVSSLPFLLFHRISDVELSSYSILQRACDNCEETEPLDQRKGNRDNSLFEKYPKNIYILRKEKRKKNPNEKADMIFSTHFFLSFTSWNYSPFLPLFHHFL